MTISISKQPHRNALILSNIHSTFEDSIAGLRLIDVHSRKILKEDPLSKHFVLVQDEFDYRKQYRIDKSDIAIANKDRHMLYHLLATVLNHFDGQKA